MQDAGVGAQLEREEIQRVITSCNEFAEAEKTKYVAHIHVALTSW